jgi:hypothetical protein
MLSLHAKKNGQIKYLLYAADSCKHGPLTRQQRLEIAHLKLEQTNNLPNKVDLVIGMKAMIITNIAPAADLANGSRGVIENIFLDPREVVRADNSKLVYLQFPPAAIIFRPYYGGKTSFPGLPSGTVPIFPMRRTFTADVISVDVSYFYTVRLCL